MSTIRNAKLVSLLAVALAAGTAGAEMSYDTTGLTGTQSCNHWICGISGAPGAYLVGGRLPGLRGMIELLADQRSRSPGRIPLLRHAAASGTDPAITPHQPHGPVIGGGSLPIVPLISVLDEELQDLEDDLEEGEDLVGVQAGPLPPADKAALGDLLDKAESRIDRILDPNEEPSLNPPDAGSVDTLIDPSTLAEFAQACHQLAEDAEAEIAEQSPDHDVIGTKIKTIKSLLSGYRDLAGIT